MSTNNTTLQQIGRMNVLAISGGRVMQLTETTIVLPVRQGYTVEIEYKPVPDLYEVRRMFRRGVKVWNKGTVSGVYAEQLGDTAYRASCYLDEFGSAS